MRTVADYEGNGAFDFTSGLNEFIVPEHMRAGLVAYVEQRAPVGGFLTAVITNDLKEAVGRADGDNICQLPAFVNFFYNHAPSPCWGSKKRMDAWLVGREAATDGYHAGAGDTTAGDDL